jgi:hypothetical protein
MDRRVRVVPKRSQSPTLTIGIAPQPADKGVGGWLTSVWSPLIVACAAAVLTASCTAHYAFELEEKKALEAHKLEETRIRSTIALETQKADSAAALALRIANQNADLEKEKLRISSDTAAARRSEELEAKRQEKIQEAIAQYSTVISAEYAAEHEFLFTILAEGYTTKAYTVFEERFSALQPRSNEAEVSLSLLSHDALKRLHVLKDEVTTIRSYIGAAGKLYADRSFSAQEHFQDLYEHLFYSESLLSSRLVNIAHGRQANTGFRPSDLEKVDYQAFKDAMTITAPKEGRFPADAVYPFKRK